MYWQLVNVYENPEMQICNLCNVKEIKHIYVLEDGHGGELEVGSHCVHKLSDVYGASSDNVEAVKNQIKRASGFLKSLMADFSRQTKNGKGNQKKKVQGHLFVISKYPNGYKCSALYGETWLGSELCASEKEAKLNWFQKYYIY